MTEPAYFPLPPNLPAPEDDGGANHLPGLTMPAVNLPSTSGVDVDLAALGPGRTVLYLYPMTGTPGVPLLPGWDDIPGARGCTPESCGFRDHHGDLQALGANVFGMSTQTIAEQREARDRLGLPFDILSDRDLRLTRALNLPAFEIEGRTMLKRLTLIVRDSTIEHVFYPIFPPDKHAAEVVAWLEEHPL